MTQFRQLNDGWNAEPNAPDPAVQVAGRDVVLSFLANPFQFPRFAEDQRLRLRFSGARTYRLGPPNGEGWYRGQCRFSSDASLIFYLRDHTFECEADGWALEE